MHIIRTVSFFAFMLSLLTGCGMTHSGTETADEMIDMSSWMAQLDDEVRVCKVSIPGTHDALTAEGFTDPQFVDDYTTQVAGLDEQLEGGLRYFDIRLVMTHNGDTTMLQTSHRTATIRLTYDDVLQKVKAFLKGHPSEFVIMKIQYDGGQMNADEQTQWSRAVQEAISRDAYKGLFAAFRPDITVKEMRGKVLLISRTAYGDPVCGALTAWGDEGTDQYTRVDSVAERTLVLAPCQEAAVAYQGGDHADAATLYVQDFYNTIGDRINEKLRAIETMYRTAIAIPDAENVWVINHTSGFSTPKMNAIGYAENASKTNAHLLSLLNAAKEGDHTSTERSSIGIIAMDYACIDTLDMAIGTLGTIKRNVMSRSLTKAVVVSNF